MVMKGTDRSSRQVTLDAPAVALGVFERALHLFPQDFRKDRAAHGARTLLSDIGRPVTPREHSLQRLLDPVRFQRKAEGVSQHHRGAENRANRISGVRPGQGRRRTMNGLKKRRGRPETRGWNQPNRATSAAAASLKISPNILLLSSTSNCAGRSVNCIAALSTYMCSSFTAG